MFNIRFKEKSSLYSLSPSIARGEISLGEFSEEFEVSIEYWDERDYEQQWVDGIARVLSGVPSSCLITSLTNPLHANFIFWWPIYRETNACVFQNQLLLLAEAPEPLDLSDPYRFVRARASVSEDGDPISEWKVSLSELDLWLKLRIAAGFRAR